MFIIRGKPSLVGYKLSNKQNGCDAMSKEQNKMPVIFVGHGSPMNAILDNEFTINWKELGERIIKPKAILCISAHWYTKGLRSHNELQPKVIYDMYGFPEELYQIKYNAMGIPEMFDRLKALLSKELILDNSWGYDHGTWSILCHMYPKADIPLVQLSVDMTASAEEQFKIGVELKALREQGVLIIASGNVVHNLSVVDWNHEAGFPWADEFDEYITRNIMSRDFEKVIHYKNAGRCAELAFFSPDHFYPLLYILGATEDNDKLTVFNEKRVLGALSMTSYLFE